VKGIDFLEKWLAAKDPSTIETSEAIKLAELVARNFESALSIRIRLGEQRALEAREITPPKEENGQVTDALRNNFAQIRLKFTRSAETQRESDKKHD
jgi:hypothetical protein